MDALTIRKNRSAGKGLIVQRQSEAEELAEIDTDIKQAKQAKDKLMALLGTKKGNTCRRAIFMQEPEDEAAPVVPDPNAKRDLKTIIDEARRRTQNSMSERNAYINEINRLEVKHLENNVFLDDSTRKYISDLKANLQQGFKTANGQHNKYNEYVSEKEYGHTNKEIKKSSACMRSQVKIKNNNARMTAVTIDSLSENELDSIETKLSNLNDDTNVKTNRLAQKGLL
jgi:hypothetical protein